ncbi:MAG TPA: nucleotide sugar dehydrogenase [Streptosporangiaceae bacterium]|jgi:nucleotide sugar dehydrogenase|nr:nucleotide sugar dehydrogenase [Streptosporangiaceae bacterium]
MTSPQLSLAVNGREAQLHSKLISFRPAGRGGDGQLAGTWSAAIVGLGYVGLPTALGLHGRCQRIIGIDVSEDRLAAIDAREADLAEADRPRLEAALADGTLELTSKLAAMTDADAVIICVPTPVDDAQVPDLTALRAACADVVSHARPGQTIILTSTTYPGTTRELLTEPLAARGLAAGTDVFVAFSPERIDPGNPDHVQRETPRVAGGATAECAARAAWVLGHLTDEVFLVSSPDAAEATKLYENIFRAVSLALANEFADACRTLALDPIEVTLAAGTKPYGFLGVFPGPGVGGHCIPCDPHYLLWQLAKAGQGSPLIEQAMRSIGLRPGQVIERAAEVLGGQALDLSSASVIVVGASYKAGVRDLRESPALPLIAGLAAAGADVSYYDPLVPVLALPTGSVMASVASPRGADFDLAIVHTVHPGADYSWVPDCPAVLDATYRFEDAPHRTLV